LLIALIAVSLIRHPVIFLTRWKYKERPLNCSFKVFDMFRELNFPRSEPIGASKTLEKDYQDELMIHAEQKKVH
jgi:hypothetical protein